MNFLNFAWNSIDASTVINCFNKSGFCRRLSDSIVVEDTDEMTMWIVTAAYLPFSSHR
ncbi:hypothetical protein T08_13948 [Trichinella sp. T8]|nr:hypothetical protein T08_13948 [Trichinella sp. T8]